MGSLPYESSPAPSLPCQDTWGVCHTRAHQHLLYLVPKHLLHEFREGFKLRLELLEFLLLILVLNIQAFLCGGFEFFPVKLFQLLDGILIYWVHHVEHLQTLLAKALQEGRGGDSRDAFPSDVED